MLSDDVLIFDGNHRRDFQAKWADPSGEDGSFNAYARVKLFYQENPQADIVSIGNSHAYMAINPLQIYHEYGISSYVLGSPNQDAGTNRLYVKETLKQHEVKLIALETGRIFNFWNGEVQHRRWVDPLPISINKMQYVWYTLIRNKKHSLEIDYDAWLSYVFPILRYHGRWENLTTDDFCEDPSVLYYHKAVHYHGFGTHYNSVEVNYSHYHDSVHLDDKILEETREFFKDIVAMCNEKEVGLLLIKTPSTSWRQEYHELISEWDAEFGITFIDYNERLEEIGIRTEADFCDSAHLNDSGATKLSLNIGEYLQANYDLTDHRGDPNYSIWNDDWQVYQQDKASYFLFHETEWASYVKRLQNPNYTIYIAAKDNLGGGSHPELGALLGDLGLSSDLSGKAHWGYMAIIDRGEVIYEHLAEEPLVYESDVNGHHIKLVSESYVQGNRASIVLDYQERFVNRRGVGILVYDNLLDDVVDRVTFDFHGNGAAYR